MTQQVKHKPFFYDVTLRDGNQALKTPWNLTQKEKVFHKLLELGVQGIEVGYAGASEMDFEACAHLAGIAPDSVVISALARAVESDITKVWEAIHMAAQPRIHTFIATSPFNMEHVLRMTPSKVQKKAVAAVALCRNLMGSRGTVQFSAEHFGDCKENLDFVIELFQAVVEQGADVINLPNTVERFRPGHFVAMVSKVVEALPDHVVVAVHTHNDLGMATATTVESFFAGAVQLETALNGLGERAGNTNLYEVACALKNCEVDLDLNLPAIYETALLMEQWSGIPIYEKAPLIGADVIAHRSGIHQHGSAQTKKMKKGAYRPMDLTMIGRKESDRIGFTSQSGRAAVYEIVQAAGFPINMEEAGRLQPVLKRISEKQGGELSEKEILKVYRKEILSVKGPLQFESLHADSDKESYRFVVIYQGKRQKLQGKGTGPIDACIHAVEKLGLYFHLNQYEQIALDAHDREAAAHAMSSIQLQKKQGKGGDPIGPIQVGRGRDEDTVKANIKALVNAINLIVR